MNLYLLTQDENRGYDTYDSCVVAAETEYDARLITPSYLGKWSKYSYSDWASCPENVKVKLIGTAIEGVAVGVVISSFNAG
jgi:hypothetical protein